MKYVIACDSFKGCCTTEQVASSIQTGIVSVYPSAEVYSVMIADGGEGTMRTLVSALQGQLITVQSHDALMRPILSEYGILPDKTAVLDMAETGGLTRIAPQDRRPLDATTYGLGEQIADAITRGCKQIIVGIGGSATTDGGQGMLQALLDKHCDYSQVSFRVLSDVNNPLYGPQGAAYVFAPQKGATPDQVEVLDQRLKQWAAQSPHPEMASLPGAGAAGGLGFALLCWCHATLVPGIEEILRCQHFDELVQGADLVFTGEGKMDAQTLMNKAPLGVLHHATKAGVPVVGVAGKVEDRERLLATGFRDVRCINLPNTPLEVAMQTDYAMQRLTATTMDILSTLNTKQQPS